MFEFPRNPSRRDLRIFGLLLAGFIPLAGWLVVRRFEVEYPWLAFAVLSAVSMVAALLAPRSLRGLHWAWHAVTFPIGWMISRVLLAIVYWGVLTPIAWTLRLRGRDALGRQFDRHATTYWTRYDPPHDVERYFRPF
jgi:hypothetical protein